MKNGADDEKTVDMIEIYRPECPSCRSTNCPVVGSSRKKGQPRRRKCADCGFKFKEPTK